MVLKDVIYAILTSFGEKDSSPRWKWQCRGREKTILKKQEIFIGNTLHEDDGIAHARHDTVAAHEVYTMKKAFKHKKFGAVLGWLFALFAVIASFGIGNMTQANSISESLSSTFSVPTYVTGIILTVFALLIIVGGIKTISKVSSVVVPLMAIFYVVAGLIVIIVNIQNLPAGVAMIFKMAFSVKAVGGATPQRRWPSTTPGGSSCNGKGAAPRRSATEK